MTKTSNYSRGGLIAVFLLLALMTLDNCSSSSQPLPPVAMRRAKTTEIHGEVRTDYYAWLRNRDSANVMAYLEAENAYTDSVMKHTVPLQDTLYNEMVARIQETDTTVPAKDGDYYYYHRTEKGKQYEIYCRKKGSLDAPEEVILDVNKLAAGHEFCDVGTFSPSPNHQLLAYSLDTNGSEEFTLYVKNLETGERLPDEIPGTSYKVVWSGDNKTLYYTTLDEIQRAGWVYRHRLGEDPENDKMMLEEPDKAYDISLSKTGTKKYILAQIESNETSEVRYLPTSDPNAEFKIFEPRNKDVEYEIEDQGNRFLILTNEDAPNFRLMSTPIAKTARANWKELVPHNDSVKIDYVEVFKDYYVLFERESGLRQIAVYDIKTNTRNVLKMPEPIYAVYPTFETEYASDVLRYQYTSLTTPTTIYDYNMKTGKTTMMKRNFVGGGFDPDNYVAERLFATAKDGTKIPISVVHRKDVPSGIAAPLLLYGYGAYGITIDPRFSSYHLSLLDRGFVYAIAHIRGGGTMGRYWYDEGKLLNKMHTFTDFIACAEYLIQNHYTSPSQLAIYGGSAGGMTIGAVINMRPDLFKAAIADVPFVDVVNTMLDPSIPLTVTEYEEWGNPHDSAYYKYMMKYSPYDNIKAQDYPAILVEAGLNDPRVGYWEPAKFTAKLRALKTDHNLLILKTNMGSGHMGSSGRYDFYKEIAFEYAFLLDQMGLTH